MFSLFPILFIRDPLAPRISETNDKIPKSAEKYRQIPKRKLTDPFYIFPCRSHLPHSFDLLWKSRLPHRSAIRAFIMTEFLTSGHRNTHPHTPHRESHSQGCTWKNKAESHAIEENKNRYQHKKRKSDDPSPHFFFNLTIKERLSLCNVFFYFILFQLVPFESLLFEEIRPQSASSKIFRYTFDNRQRSYEDFFQCLRVHFPLPIRLW